MDIYLVLGIIGMAMILIGFLMNQLNKWSNDGLVYDVINLVGSVLLVIYALPPLAWPFIILNGVWAVFTLKDVLDDLGLLGKKKKKIKIW